MLINRLWLMPSPEILLLLEKLPPEIQAMVLRFMGLEPFYIDGEIGGWSK